MVGKAIMSSLLGLSADVIIPNLWIGNRSASQDIHWLRGHNIQAVFNCTKDIPFAQLPLRFYRIPVDDNLAADEIRNMELWAPEIVVKLTREYNKGQPILVHCHAGMQRSAAVVAMFLIAKYRCTTDEAIAYIKMRRVVAFPVSVNFRKSIEAFEKLFQEYAMNSHDPTSIRKIPFPSDLLGND
jgi:protein tyrosine phosphatase